MFLLTFWLIGLRMAGKRTGRYGLIDLNRTALLFNVAQPLLICSALRGVQTTIPILMVDPVPEFDDYSTLGLLLNLVQPIVTAAFLVAAIIGRLVYGSSDVLDCWLRFFQGPLEFFESIHIG